MNDSQKMSNPHITTSKKIFSLATPLGLIMIILLVSFAVYFNALFNDFAYDDRGQVVENHWIKNTTYIPEIFSKGVWEFKEEKTNYYRPLMHMIYMVNYHIFGLRPWGFHLVNILFHSGVSMLVFLIALKLLGHSKSSGSTPYLFPSFIAALLFAVHPIHTEAVTWIAGLPDVSFTFFCLLSLYLYIRSAEGAKYRYFFSVVSFSFAVFCKEPALTLPIILIAYDFIFRKEGDRFLDRFKRYIPYIVVAGVYLILRFSALRGFAPMHLKSMYPSLNIFQYLLNAFSLLIGYLEKLLLPTNLNVLHLFIPIRSVFERNGILVCTLALAFVVLTLMALRKNKTAFFGILLIVVPLLPAFYFVGIPYPFAERYLYMPSFGFVLLISLLVARMANNPTLSIASTVALIAVISLFSIGTIRRNAIWKDNLSLWTDTVKKSPEGFEAYKNLADSLLETGRIDEAIEQFHIALRLKPDFPEAHINLGKAYSAKGLIDQAIEQYQIAIRLNPELVEARNNLGNDFLKKGWTDQAIEQYQIAIRLRPDLVEAHNNLGAFYYESGAIDKAIEYFQTAVRLNPEFTDAHTNLGHAFYKQGLIHEAIEQYRIVVGLEPGSGEGHCNLGSAYVEVGEIDKGIKYLQMAIKLNPDFPSAHENLGNAFYKKNLMDQAIEQYHLALRLQPELAEARKNLGNAFYKKNLMDQAIEQYHLALRLQPDSVEAHYNIGVAFFKKGLMGKAIEHFQTAVRLNPNYAEAHNNLGSAYAEKGLMDKAIEHFQIAAKLIPSNQTFRNNLTKAYEMKSSAVKAGHKTGSSRQK